MKGRLLSEEEIKNLKEGDLVWIEDNEDWYESDVCEIYKYGQQYTKARFLNFDNTSWTIFIEGDNNTDINRISIYEFINSDNIVPRKNRLSEKTYIGMCNIPNIMTISAKIKANSEEQAEEKFMKYVEEQDVGITYILEDWVSLFEDSEIPIIE